MVTVGDLLAGSGLPRLEARALLAHATERSREELVAWPERVVDEAATRRFEDVSARRRQGVPLAYLLGEREFFGRPFAIGPAVLVPRPETELLVQLTLEAAREGPVRILDLGTGSGCVAISLALELPRAQVLAVDVSEQALEVARANAARLGASVTFAQSDWFAEVDGRFNLIVSNPPYVATEDPHFEALRFEPEIALAAGADGLGCIRAIVAEAPGKLVQAGWLLLEHGRDQGAAVRQLLDRAGFTEIATHLDAAGLERVTVGCFGRR